MKKFIAAAILSGSLLCILIPNANAAPNRQNVCGLAFEKCMTTAYEKKVAIDQVNAVYRCTDTSYRCRCAHGKKSDACTKLLKK